MRIFEKGQAAQIGVKTRAAAAEALDQASQARLRTPPDPDYWIPIPGGPFPSRDQEAYESLPTRKVTVPAFRIAKFPVTVWEYHQFLCAHDGLEPPPEWEDQFQHPSRPVTRVSWHDAQSYCQWSGTELPTDEQWEFAARGSAGRIFPWGPENQPPDDARANFNDNVGAASPVGLFPDGESPEGVADLAGNVWEWTRSDFSKPGGSSAAPEDNVTAEVEKSVRGGSFSGGADDLTAVDRIRDQPHVRYSNVGFRVVRE